MGKWTVIIIIIVLIFIYFKMSDENKEKIKDGLFNIKEKILGGETKTSEMRLIGKLVMEVDCLKDSDCDSLENCNMDCNCINGGCWK